MVAKLIKAGYLQPALRNDVDAITRAIARMKQHLRGGGSDDGDRPLLENLDVRIDRQASASRLLPRCEGHTAEAHMRFRVGQLGHDSHDAI
jgi:hypothetical protein